MVNYQPVMIGLVYLRTVLGRLLQFESNSVLLGLQLVWKLTIFTSS